MLFFKFSTIIGLLVLCGLAQAKIVYTTLSSSSGDQVTITYRITQENGNISIEFLNVKKTLGEHKRKYRNSDEIVALFFDKKGGYPSDVSFTGSINTTAFTIPSGLTYTRINNDGYFIIDHTPAPKLHFQSNTTKKVNLSIPIYLAKHSKKGTYELFQDCGSLEIAITPEMTPQTSGKKPGQVIDTVFEEVEGNNDEEIAWSLISSIKTELQLQESTLSDELKGKVGELNALKLKITDKNLKKEIEQITNEYLDKKNELKRQEEAKKQEEAKAQNEKSEKDLFIRCIDTNTCNRYLEIYGDTGTYSDNVKKIRDDLRKEDDKQKKRNIWMILGGALLAALLFVGNQVMRTISNNRTQRSIMEMQQDLTHKATSRVERKAASAIQNKTHQITSSVRNKPRELINIGTTKTHPFKSKKKTENKPGTNPGNNKGKNNKPISI